MILETIFNMIKALLISIINLIPDFVTNLSIPTEVISTFTNYFRLAWYVLPMTTLLTVFGLYVAITNTRIAYNLILRVWDALPFT